MKNLVTVNVTGRTSPEDIHGIAPRIKGLKQTSIRTVTAESLIYRAGESVR